MHCGVALGEMKIAVYKRTLLFTVIASLAYLSLGCFVFGIGYAMTGEVRIERACVCVLWGEQLEWPYYEHGWYWSLRTPEYDWAPYLYVARLNSHVIIPLWPVFAILIVVWIYLYVRARNLSPAKCTQCGYDLRGAVSDRCSECGAPIEHRRKGATRD